MEIFSAPGRTEICGNHTDHQNGEVLAASVNLDTIGIVKKTDDNVIRLVSDNYDEIIIRLDDVSVKEKEKETTKALIKGVVSGFLERKYAVGGFQAYITSDVLIGAGLSSSAAFETLIGTILSGLYNCGTVSATEIAIIGQYAENVYFGKPCGLMDQMASSIGNLVHIDFANPEYPYVEKIDFDMEKYGYRLCITDTKGSHADLTDEYAAIPKEMKLVAKYFGKEFAGEKVPSLEEVLRFVKGKARLNIELKSGDTVYTADKVAELIQKYDMQNDCVITSFDYNMLKRVKELTDDIQVGYILSIAYGDFYSMDDVDFFSMNASFLSKQIVDAIHNSGKQVYAWTVNNATSIKNLTNKGVDNIITDDPILARETIYSRDTSETLVNMAKYVFNQ